MKSNTQIRPEFVLKALIGVGLAVNLFILFTGLHPPEPNAPPVSINSLERQLTSLRDNLNQRQLPTEVEAEARAIGLFSLAQDQGVELINWNNQSANEPLGTAGQVNLMRSSLEFRGEREKLIATIGSFNQLFGDNFLVANVELRGGGDNWLLKLNLTQLLVLT